MKVLIMKFDNETEFLMNGCLLIIFIYNKFEREVCGEYIMQRGI